MNNEEQNTLTASQFKLLSTALHQAVQHASDALSKWLRRPASITIDSVEQIPLQQAASVLGEDESPICCCTMEIKGELSGELILAFDESSGLALADMLLGQAVGTATEWDELERSAALETTNIIGCAYLNELVQFLPQIEHRSRELLPSPPTFRRDFAESVLQSALMGQAMASDHLLVAHAAFEVDGASLNWSLLFVPDAESMADLHRWLGDG
jgi:chemotaxis protein CheC